MTEPKTPTREQVLARLESITAKYPLSPFTMVATALSYLIVNTAPADPVPPTDAHKRMSYALGQLAGALLASDSVAVGRGMMVRLIEGIGHGLTYEQALSKAGMTPASQPAGGQPAVPDITGATIIRAGVNHVVPDVEPERSAAGARSQWVYTRLWHNAPDGHPIALACPPDGGDGLGWQFMTAAQAREVATELLSAAARAEAEEATGD